MNKNKKNLIIIIAVIIVLLALDQVTKVLCIEKTSTLIPGVLNINYKQSIEGSFGVGQKGTITFIITNVIVLGIIFKFMKMQKEQIDGKTYGALCLIIAGAIGNLIDRLFRGYVVKFIDFTPILKFIPVINIADILIILGWILLAVFFALFAIKVRKENINK